MGRILLTLATFVFTATFSEAGEFNEVLSIGDSAPTWQDLPGTDGKLHSLSDLKDASVVVVVFTCASCPTAVDYEQRIQDLNKQYGKDGRVAVVAICANQVKEDLLPALTERVKDQKLEFTYLHDSTQKIAKAFGAVYTPEFYILNQKRQVMYMGAMDDSTMPDKVEKRFVEDAVKALLAGETPSQKEVMPRGCRVRYARERRGQKSL